jgi:hypothetical protein
MSLVETREYKDHKIKIYYDEYAEGVHPRHTQDNFGIMGCYHGRYNLGDSFVKENYPKSEDLVEMLKRKGKELIVLPVYMYDHSGICINTTGYSCPWDSGQVGVIYISRKEAREQLGITRLTKKQEERVKDILRSEVEEYSQYLQGFVYYYEVYDKVGDLTDSCSGFIGMDMETNGLMDSVRCAIG